MIKIGIGQGEDIDTFSATRVAIDHCKQRLGECVPKAGIVLAPMGFDHQLMLKEIQRHFPGIELVGGTTSGELSSDLGFSEDSVSLMVFDSDTIEIKAGVGRRLSLNLEAAIKNGIDQARAKLSQKAALCLAFPKWDNVSTYEVVQALNVEFGPDCPVFGGVPGKELSGEETPLQFFGDEILKDAVPFLLFAGPVKYAFSLSNSWQPVGVRAKVSEAIGHKVMRIGQMSALDFYRYYLGDHTDPFAEFPLAVFENNSSDFIIRSPEGHDEVEGSILFSGPIDQGKTVQLTEVTRERLLKDTRDSVETLVQSMQQSWQPDAALVFSCAGRKHILGSRTKEELQILENLLPSHLPVYGFYSFGELCPLKHTNTSRLHNCTMVTLLIGEDDSRQESVKTRELPKPTVSRMTTQSENSREALERENRFLQKKLLRSENYREQLESTKDQTAALLKKINREINAARMAIKQKNEALQKALALANEIQVNLLPRQNPRVAGFDIAGQSVYCSDTGGDYYDFLNVGPVLSQQPFDIVVGDVSGHGIEAALLMTTARALLRSRAAQPGSIAQIITEVNRSLSLDVQDSGRFMTLFYLSIDPKNHSLKWVRAGHDPAIVYNPVGDTFEELGGAGVALGVDEDWQYEEYQKFGLSKGQIILLGTDGVWETRNPRGELFGKTPLYDIIRQNAHAGARDILNTVSNAITDFRKHLEPEDDVTMVVTKVEGVNNLTV